MRKIAGYLTKNRSEKDKKIAQSTHENECIKPEKTFCRNSKQLLSFVSKPKKRKGAHSFIKQPSFARGKALHSFRNSSIGMYFRV